MLRRLITFVVVAAVTAVGSLWWLHDGDLRGATQPGLAELKTWDAPAGDAATP